MDRDSVNEAKIIDSWMSNAAPWTDTVRLREIESRRVTDGAIVDVVRQQGPHTVLDIGCGEGWLARVLAETGIEVTGVDVVPELIQRARESGGGRFLVASFEDLVAGTVSVTAQLGICNFSLLGKTSVEQLLGALPLLLGAGGMLVVQTVHPLMACGDGIPYHSGWREETWGGFRRPYRAAAPWYFRTLTDWTDLLRYSGFQLTQIHEPLDPASSRPVSLILVAAVPDARVRTL